MRCSASPRARACARCWPAAASAPASCWTTACRWTCAPFPPSFGAAWLYLTGSSAHNIALRRLAQRQGLTLNEYGLFRGSDSVAGATEAEVYRALGLQFIEPALREARGEIEAAAGRPRVSAPRPLAPASAHAATTP